MFSMQVFKLFIVVHHLYFIIS